MRRLLVPTLVAVLMMVAGVAHAAWLATGSGSASSTAGTIPQGSTPDVELSDGDAVVSWTQTTTPTVDGYLVARYLDGGAKVAIGSGCDLDPVAGETCTETSVPEGRWRYTVTPKLGNWLGAESAQSDQLHVPTSAPSDLSAVTSSETTIDLTWTDESQIETGYRVEPSADGSDWTTLAAVDLAADSTGYSDTTLSCGTTRHYRVKALSTPNGESAYSTTATATTDPCATATTMSVTQVVVLATDSTGTGGSTRWWATVEVTVTDGLGQPVSGASVSGSWTFSGGTSAQQGAGNPNCQTDASGACTVTRSDMQNNIQDVTLAVEDVTKSGLSYTVPTPKPSATASKPS